MLNFSQSKASFLRLLVVAVLLLANFFIWIKVSDSSGGELKVVFLNVGQGDAIYIESPSGRQVLIDGGPDGKVLSELGKVMPIFDRSIDVIIATHPDSDHIGGLIDVLEKFDVKFFIEPGNGAQTLVYQSLQQVLALENLDRVLARRGLTVDLGQGAYLEVLFPDRDVSKLDANTASVITKLNLGNISFLLTGDAPASIEKYLVNAYGKGLGSEVLKVGHHGSRTSSNEIFIGFASPTYAVISAGEGNRYGHPHKEVLENFSNFGVEILETKNGRVIFETNGESLWLK